jgi:hypothetical protein
MVIYFSMGLGKHFHGWIYVCAGKRERTDPCGLRHCLHIVLCLLGELQLHKWPTPTCIQVALLIPPYDCTPTIRVYFMRHYHGYRDGQPLLSRKEELPVCVSILLLFFAIHLKR